MATKAETVRGLSIVMADAAERALTHRVRARDRCTAAVVGLAVAGTFVLGAGGGRWVGDSIRSGDHHRDGGQRAGRLPA